VSGSVLFYREGAEIPQAVAVDSQKCTLKSIYGRKKDSLGYLNNFYRRKCVMDLSAPLRMWKRILFIFLVPIIIGMHSSISLAQDNVAIQFLGESTAASAGFYGHSEYVFTRFPVGKSQDSIRRVINKELLKYPKAVLKKARLGRIVVVDEAYCIKGDTVFAMVDGTYVVPVENGNLMFVSGTSAFLPGVIHHELSSIMMYELSTDTVVYEELLKIQKSFLAVTPYYSDEEKLKASASAKTFAYPRNKDNYFVLGNTGYSLLDYENDFNTIVQCLFTPALSKELNRLLVDPKLKLWEFLDEAKQKNYPIGKKVQMVIEYYKKIDPVFTEEYFRTLER
jgi:hypothetical protein